MANKHGKVVTYREGPPLIKSYNPLNTRSVTSSGDKYVSSSLAEDLWAPS